MEYENQPEGDSKMLKTPERQGSFYDVEYICESLIPPESFYRKFKEVVWPLMMSWILKRCTARIMAVRRSRRSYWPWFYCCNSIRISLIARWRERACMTSRSNMLWDCAWTIGRSTIPAWEILGNGC